MTSQRPAVGSLSPPPRRLDAQPSAATALPANSSPRPVYDSHLLDLEKPAFVHRYQTTLSPTAFTSVSDVPPFRTTPATTTTTTSMNTAPSVNHHDSAVVQRLFDAHLLDKVVGRPYSESELRALKQRRRTSMNQYIEQHKQQQQQQQQQLTTEPYVDGEEWDVPRSTTATAASTTTTTGRSYSQPALRKLTPISPDPDESFENNSLGGRSMA